MTGSEGSLSYVVFTVVFFLTALSVSLFLLMSLSLNQETKRFAALAESAEYDEIIQGLIQDYLSDPTSDADSTFDSFYGDYNERDFDGITCTIRDISSAINLNFVDPDILLRSDLKMTVSAIIDRDAFIEQRKDIGLTLDIGDFSSLFLGDSWQDSYTLWGRANINIAEEQALRTLLKERGVSEMLIYQFLQGREQDYITPAEYAGIAGSSGSVLSSVMGVDPPINVNFVKAEILDAVFQALFGQDNESQYPWQNKRDSILSRRMSGELNAEDLEEILAVSNETRVIAQYLGVKTSYWEVMLTPDDGPSETIILFTPPDGSRSVQIVRRIRTEEAYD